MTRFEKDRQEVINGNSVEIMKKRKAEIEKLYKEGRACRNSFRMQFILADLAKLSKEYKALDALI